MDSPATPQSLRARLDDLTIQDAARVRRELRRITTGPDDSERSQRLAALAEEVSAGAARLERRRASVPSVQYPAALPITQHRDDIAAALENHQVVVVAGETGSGKTTQVPKICLDVGRGVRGMIGHTQPRRLAARTVADRIADELSTPLGQAVGYSVRFTDRAGEATLIRLMTDGILLAETRRDPLLRRYDTIIIDEAHERSLNIDFLLGYLVTILPRRPDLSVVIMSATIDPQRFARHFGEATPVVEVSGRTYPVEVRYRPFDPAESDQTQAVLDAVGELERTSTPGGDVLVFLSGEREIRDTTEALRGALRHQDRHNTEVLPLYARLSTADQHRVFAPHPGRRIVLATNVAETSLTVPGIRYVIDPGTARISRFNRRTKVQRLPIEKISQASARQRAGRCGRLSDGIAVRLYSEQDFDDRPTFTDPEILRTSLASVLLQMADLRLGEITEFPFMDPPDRRDVRDGLLLLQELGAIEQRDGKHRLTPLGRRLARIPLDPRLGRMMLAAGDLGCVPDALVVVAGLTIQDPREQPEDAKEDAARQHARFRRPTSDFVSYLLLWDYLQEQQASMSGNAFRRMCRREHLHYLRIREWQDLIGQLRRTAREIGLDATAREPGSPIDEKALHRSLLAGLLSRIGHWDPEAREYAGARGSRFRLSPGSSLARKPPPWVMAAELVETNRLWAHRAARIDPEWAEPLAAGLVTRTYSEPRWRRKRAEVVADEQVLLYGLPIVSQRPVPYGRVDVVASHELFLRHALVGAEWDTRHTFPRANLATRAELAEAEERTRRRGVVIDDDELFDLYATRVPDDVVSGRTFDAWWKDERRRNPDLLTFTTAQLLRTTQEVRTDGYPDTWHLGDLALPLTYRFEPGRADDGVTIHVPVAVLAEVPATSLEWQVPGLREELLVALLRALPKPVRRRFVPAPAYAADVLGRLEPGRGSILEAVAHELTRIGGTTVSAADFDLDRVPAHLRMTVSVERKGEVLAQGKDLAALQRRFAETARSEVARASGGVERTGLTSWSIGTLPRTVDVRHGSHTIVGYPALVDEGATAGVRVFTDRAEQDVAMPLGTRRLLMCVLPSPTQAVSSLDVRTKLLLTGAPHDGPHALVADCCAAAVDDLMVDAGGPAWDERGFGALRDAVREDLVPRTEAVARSVAAALEAAQTVRSALTDAERSRDPDVAEVAADVRRQMAAMVHAGFAAETGAAQLRHLPRYLQAAARRLERVVAATRPQVRERDLELMDLVHGLEDELQDTVRRLPATRRNATDVRQARWLIEELRVSFFAQEMGTAQRVSEKRVRAAVRALNLS